MFAPDLLQGQRILVTGGGTGLGRAMAERFLQLGADVAICGRRQAVCDETAALWRETFPGRRVDTFGVDIRVAQGVEVMAPHWAYHLQVGMRLEELRTVSGATNRNVRIQALTTVQMQFSHSRGTQVELLTNIVDPNQYLGPALASHCEMRGAGWHRRRD